MSTTLTVILILVAVIAAALMTYMVVRLKFEKINTALEERLRSGEQERTERDRLLNGLEEDLKASRDSLESLRMELTRKESELSHQQEKLEGQQKEVEKLQEKFTKDFEILASKILEEKSDKFTAKNKENIEQILTPLQEKIKSFEKKVEDTHKESLIRQTALREQILGLTKLNEQMSKDAVNLTRALKGDSKKQ